MEWSIEVTTRRKIEDNGKIVYSIYPRKAMEESGLDEGVFWEQIRKDLTRKAQLKSLPQTAISSFIREASRNMTNEISLVIRY